MSDGSLLLKLRRFLEVLAEKLAKYQKNIFDKFESFSEILPHWKVAHNLRRSKTRQ